MVHEGWVLFGTGLLLHEFKKPVDKVSLRTHVLKWLDMLKQHGVAKDALPGVLAARCDSACKFQVAI